MRIFAASIEIGFCFCKRKKSVKLQQFVCYFVRSDKYGCDIGNVIASDSV